MDKGQQELTRRERQIMDAIYRLGEASVAEVQAEIPDAPTYNTVRTLLKVLTDKGYLTHSTDGPRYIYRPTTPLAEAQTSALRRILATFFDGSPKQAMAALVDISAEGLSNEDLEELESIIRDARREGR